MIADRILIIGLIFYFLAIVFNYYDWPGTVELSIFSVPTVSLLLFRYYRIHFKTESNMFIRFFSLLMSIFISISLFIPLISLSDNINVRPDQLLLMSWIMLIMLNIVYYSYYLLVAKQKTYKSGYLILIVTCMLFLIEGAIVYTLDQSFSDLKYTTFIAISFLSAMLILQIFRKKRIPKLELGYSLLIGSIFINFVNIFFLYHAS